MTKTWVIYNKKESEAGILPDCNPAFWSNQNGWGGLWNATRFSQREHENGIRLPIYGEWMLLSDEDGQSIDEEPRKWDICIDVSTPAGGYHIHRFFETESENLAREEARDMLSELRNINVPIEFTLDEIVEQYF